ncbi:hypothetical protein OEZ86_010290 [Tetradesmus obliquus]|nr:hypothetical protein OEZ86_010290 [Tetradesmus obliquus]
MSPNVAQKQHDARLASRVCWRQLALPASKCAGSSFSTAKRYLVLELKLQASQARRGGCVSAAVPASGSAAWACQPSDKARYLQASMSGSMWLASLELQRSALSAGLPAACSR